MAKAKKQNFFLAYFNNFGLRQICDMLMIIGAIVLIVGLCTTQLVLTIGLGVYIVACIIALVRSVKVLLTSSNKRSPECKSAIINTVIMGVIFALAIFGFVYSLLF